MRLHLISTVPMIFLAEMSSKMDSPSWSNIAALGVFVSIALMMTIHFVKALSLAVFGFQWPLLVLPSSLAIKPWSPTGSGFSTFSHFSSTTSCGATPDGFRASSAALGWIHVLHPGPMLQTASSKKIGVLDESS